MRNVFAADDVHSRARGNESNEEGVITRSAGAIVIMVPAEFTDCPRGRNRVYFYRELKHLHVTVLGVLVISANRKRLPSCKLVRLRAFERRISNGSCSSQRRRGHRIGKSVAAIGIQFCAGYSAGHSVALGERSVLKILIH